MGMMTMTCIATAAHNVTERALNCRNAQAAKSNITAIGHTRKINGEGDSSIIRCSVHESMAKGEEKNEEREAIKRLA
jgi:hypothetical protein